jgi:hypothetical protein
MKMQHKFVTTIPDLIDEGVIYISMEYATAIHKCCCGCGNKVVTPFSNHDWKLTFDGVSVSLNPSIGNWSFPCQSHYWITSNEVKWAEQWSHDQIAHVRTFDHKNNQEQITKESKKYSPFSNFFSMFFTKKTR